MIRLRVIQFRSNIVFTLSLPSYGLNGQQKQNKKTLILKWMKDKKYLKKKNFLSTVIPEFIALLVKSLGIL